MNDTQTLTISEFILARLKDRQDLYEYPPDFVEDTGSARGPGWGDLGGECDVCGAYQFSGLENVVEDAWYEHMEQVHQRQWVLEDIMSKRAIVDHVEDWLKGIPDAGTYEAAMTVLRLLAAPYRTHPDYQEAWA